MYSSILGFPQVKRYGKGWAISDVRWGRQETR